MYKTWFGLLFIISILTSWTLLHVVIFIHNLGMNKSPCIWYPKTKLSLYFCQTFDNKIKFHNTKNIDSCPNYEIKNCKILMGIGPKLCIFII